MRRICQAFMLGSSTLLALILFENRVACENFQAGNGAYWVLLDSKPIKDPVNVSYKSLARRQNRSSIKAVSWYDYPVNPEYIKEIEQTGVRIRNTSRWLNAVSVTADENTIDNISRLPFVKKIKRVSSFTDPIDVGRQPVNRTGKTSLYDYGPSYNQIGIIGVDSLHDAGYSGAGVLIGILDTGFDTSHISFSNIVAENRIAATYDFINGDPDVADGPDIQRNHGTQVFSAMAGFDEGSLIGPAFGAEFVLAKTEIISEEIQAEEDNWVAAAEWMDSIGVDIISSSLGYID